MSSSISDNFFILQFAEARQPKYTERKGRGYIEFGERNDYPDYLLDLFNKSSKHGAIVSGKAGYVSGNGFTGGNERMLKKPNPSETLNDILRKITLDIEIFGGYYLEIIWSINGKGIAEMRHIDYMKMRASKDCTEFFYKKDWRNHRDEPTILPAFNPNHPAGRQILFVKDYRPGQETYPLPKYFPSLNYIEADIEVSQHTLGNAKTGFSASKLITLPNGEPGDDEKRKVTRMFENTFSGADGKKFMLSFVQNAERKPIVDDLGASDLTKEDFSRVDAMIQQNIYAGHQITSPSLFGIAEPGKLGTRTELRDAYEIFKNTYVNDRQIGIEGMFNYLLTFFGGGEPLKITPVEPIGYEFSEQTIASVMTRDEIRKKLGLPTEADATVEAAPGAEQGQTTEALVNENVKNLTGRQHQQLLRIIRQFQKGQITREVATTLLRTSLGLTEADIAVMLAIDNQPAQFSDAPGDVDKEMQVFAEYGEKKEKFTVHQSKAVTFSAFDSFYDFRDIQILEILKAQPLTPPADIAKALRLKPIDVVERLGVLQDLGIIELDADKVGYKVTGSVRDLIKEMGGDTEAEKKKARNAQKKATTVEFDIRYSYEWKKVVPPSERNSAEHPSRPFCIKLMDLDRFYTRAEIESISRRLGYDVFTRGGGWWGKSPTCRHIWQSNIVVKKEK